MADPIEFQVRADTESAEEAFDRLTRDLQRLEGEVKDVDRAADSLSFDRAAQSAQNLARSSESVTKAVKAKNRAMGLAVNELSEFVGGVTMAIPGTGMLASQIQAAGNNVVGLSASMGPLGIALGLVAGLLPAVIALFTNTTEETDAYTDATDDATDATNLFTDALERRSAALRAQRVEAGVGSLADVEAELNNAERSLAALEQAEATVIRTGAAFEGQLTNVTAAVDAQRRRVQQLREAYREAREEQNLAMIEENDLDLEESRGQGRSRGARRTPSAANQDRALAQDILGMLDQQRSIEEQLVELSKIQAGEDARAAQAAAEAIAAKQEELRLVQEQIAAQEKLVAQAARLKAERKAAIAQRAEENERLAVANEVTGSIGNTLASTFQIALDGEKNFGDALLESLKQELANIAIRNLYLGLERIATGVATRDPAMFASAAQHFAVAAAAGGAAGGIAAATGGGGGAPRNEPERDDDAQGGGGDGGTIVINFNQPATEAQIGRQQEQAARAARRRYGR